MSLDPSSSPRGDDLWALLVGINEYKSPSVSTLSGCVNDVEAIRIYLINNMSVPDTQIKVLTNQEATRKGIIDAFESFLINNPQLSHGSQMLFHYSGHGSQMLDTTGTEPDGMDETIVPHDSRQGDVFDIPDKTLGALLDHLAAAKGENITVILDSCHSGSGTRELRAEGAAPTRRAPADDRLPPAGLDASLRRVAAMRGAGQTGWSITSPNHVLLAGCLDREESNEYGAPKADVSQVIRHGAFTYFALEYLRQAPSQATYADWHAYVKAHVSSIYPKQTPQCEGQLNRTIFGGAYMERDPFIPIRGLQGGSLTFGAGLVHGVHAGTELAIYPTTVTTKQNLPVPLATARVKSVTATTAQADFISAPQRTLPRDAHALVTQQVYLSIRQTVALMPGESTKNQQALNALREAILNAGGNSKPSAYLELLADPLSPVNLRVTAEDGKLSISDDAGKLLVTPETSADTVRRSLESIARFSNVLELANQQQSQLTGKFALRLRRCASVVDSECTIAEDLPAEPDGPITLEYDSDLPDRSLYVIDVTNNSTVGVYPHLFVLNSDYSIYRMYPTQGQSEVLERGKTLSCGWQGSGGSVLKVTLAGDAPGEERWDISHERLKLIVTTSQCDLELLEQEPLSVPAERRVTRGEVSPLQQLLKGVTSGVGTRSAPLKPTAIEDWTASILPYTVVRAAQTTALSAPKGNIRLGDGITLEKPQGFEGKISVAPLEQARRSISDEPSLKLPPGLAHLQDVFLPIARSGTRGLSGQPLVITVETDENSRKMITPGNPMRLRLPDGLSADDDLWPIAFDGEDYLPVGYATDGGAVEIVRLPQAVAGVSAQGAPTRRGIGRSVKLFIFKKMGGHDSRLDLRYVENSDGAAEYGEVRRERFKSGDRIAVFVHGFLSDTGWMARDVAPFLRTQVLPYEHALTWDYETFGTTVEANGANLATKLRQQVGCGANDELTVHIYAHSMGTLVSRCMVELSGGNEFVDRMVLAGPPNRGTTLATVSRGFTYLLSAMVNHIGVVPLAGPLRWTMKQLYEQGNGWKDLTVDSDITKRLNSLGQPSNVPYLVLAGKNTLDSAQGNRLGRLARKTLDTTLDAIFGESENDAVIGMLSMQGLRHGGYPNVRVATLPCNHFSYFSNAEGQAAIKDWVKS